MKDLGVDGILLKWIAKKRDGMDLINMAQDWEK